jgi:hypothetical protein
MTMKLMLITNNPEIAIEAQTAGVDRIFVDLEINGKFKRQGHLDTVISSHTMGDISLIREVLDKSELLVRINPIHERTKSEIEEAIFRGADIIMLPMFKTPNEVENFVNLVNGRAKTCLLIETSQALVRIDEILKIEKIDEIHIGLNDLHISMGIDFMFELLSGGIVEYLCGKFNEKGIRYGFGGIARLGKGTLRAETILGEHYRLGSNMVILSRTFHNRAETIAELKNEISITHEIQKIRNYERVLQSWTIEQFLENKNTVRESVGKIIRIV